jgi:hypothetical protein
MKRDVLIYGLVGGILITVLKWTEYRFLVIDHSIEIYGGLIAAVFAALGAGERIFQQAPRDHRSSPAQPRVCPT